CFSFIKIDSLLSVNSEAHAFGVLLHELYAVGKIHLERNFARARVVAARIDIHQSTGIESIELARRTTHGNRHLLRRDSKPEIGVAHLYRDTFELPVRDDLSDVEARHDSIEAKAD